MLKVIDIQIGDCIDVINIVNNQEYKNSAGPFIRTSHSLIDRTGSNWKLEDCGDRLCIPANPRELTFEQFNEFRLQVKTGEVNRGVLIENEDTDRTD